MNAAPTRTPARPEANPAPILKTFYVGLYCTGALSKPALIALFRQHPEWRAA